MENEHGTHKEVKEMAWLVWQIIKSWTRGRRRILEEFGLTWSQIEMMGIIVYLSKRGKELTQITLSQEADIDTMTTSTILRNLEKKGYIKRAAHSCDSRAKIVQLTPEGEEILHKAGEKMKKDHSLVFDNIDLDALKQQLTLLLEAIKSAKEVNK